MCAPQRPPPTGCRAMLALARGLLDCQHCHRPKGSLAHTPHSSQRAAHLRRTPQRLHCDTVGEMTLYGYI